MTFVDNSLQTLIVAHKKVQKVLNDEDPDERRIGYEALMALDNRAYALLAIKVQSSAALLIWFNMVNPPK